MGNCCDSEKSKTNNKQHINPSISQNNSKYKENNPINNENLNDEKENNNLSSKSHSKDKKDNNIFTYPSSKTKKENNPSSLQFCSEDKLEPINIPINCNSKSSEENNYLSNQNSNKINNLQIQCNSKDINYNTFPRDTKYEKELNSNFKYFNVFWYDPNKTTDFELFKKCFENVEFYKGYNLYSTINFFKKEIISEWIVITPGSHGEELILNLENFECIKTFFIYCMNTEHHEWAKKIKKVGCLTSDPEILCQKLIELNKDYIIPNFNYKSKENNEINKNEMDLYSSSFKSALKIKNKIMNKYNNFCIKFFNYVNGNEVENDLRESMADNNSLLNMASNLVEGIDNSFFTTNINIAKNITLLSLYFNNYPYLLNLLSFQEIKDLFQVQPTIITMLNSQMNLMTLMENLCKKIMDNECILDEKDTLKEIQISLIKVISHGFSAANLDRGMFINYYQINNFFRDIDFCIKIYFSSIFPLFNNKKHNYLNDIMLTMSVCELRYPIYVSYISTLAHDYSQYFSEEEQNIINDSLTIKDFIILGDNQFHDMIKTIEKKIKSNSFKYLNVEQISNYLNKRKKEIGKKILTYFYFLIIKSEDFQKNLEKFFRLFFDSGITFIVFVYIENEDNVKFFKNQINAFLPTILVYSPEDIICYLSNNFKFFNPLILPNIEELGEIMNIKIPKISFEQNDEDKYQDGCFELAETFDVNIIRNKFLLRMLDNINYTMEIPKIMYNIYKDHNALDLFFSQNCLYFGWSLYPESINRENSSFAKRILYMYCREEKEHQKSFYRIINEDLKSRDPYKIYQYINVLALINEMIEEELLLNYKG